jgi:hypothetical protein
MAAANGKIFAGLPDRVKDISINMTFRSRKLFIWFISLGAVLVVFLLYSLLSGTARIEIESGLKVHKADSNVGSEVGVVGEVGVGPVEMARFTTLNKDKQIEREFGFERLLHKSGDEWAIEKPFMNIYRPSFKCYITADQGDVQMETAAGKTSPKDAKFSGNVKIHIVPEKNSKMGEGFIYLDDVTYISEKSQFSTDGPVKFTSADVQMFATGMELVYNEEIDQLDYLRIINMESLHIKPSSQGSLFSPQRTTDTGPADTNSEIQTAGTPKTGSPDAGGKTETATTAGKEQTGQAEGGFDRPTTRRKYRCLFSKNVLIDHPEQVIFTDELFINNIFEPKGPAPSSTETAPSPSTVEAGKTPTDVDRQDTEAKLSRFEQQDKTSTDIVVRCDNGIFITPMESTNVYGNTVKPPITNTTMKTWKTMINSININNRPTFVAQRIDYNYGTSAGDVVASGSSELMFYTNDMAGPNNVTGALNTVPVTVTAERKATFLPAENKAVFEGDCVCRMFRTDVGVEQEHMLSAPRLTVNLYKDKKKSSGGSVNAIEYLTADNGVVQLANAKWKVPAEAKKLLGFVKLKCRRFDYDPTKQMFLASGPDGLIAADNSKIIHQNRQRKKPEKFSLSQPCYAVLRNFDILKYHLDSDYLVADSNLGQMLIDYFPIVDGKEGEHIEAGTSHVEANLYENAERKLELSTISATTGVSYREKDRQFAGSKLFYNASKSLMTILGDETQPCLYNGAHVDQIEYNLQTDTVKTQITAPGQLQ